MNLQWKEPAVPRHVIQMLVVDSFARLLFIHRSEKCKSAKNVWSLPSGTHEIGERITDCIHRELKEEFSLEPKTIYLLTQYENIAGDTNSEKQYHWVITLFVVVVDNLDDLVNNEPELHDRLDKVYLLDLIQNGLPSHYQFHPSLQEVLDAQSSFVFASCHLHVDEYLDNILHI